jgi:hypothetical protein
VTLDLPISGLRVEGSRLRIQRPLVPVIELDARLLDDVQSERDRGGLGVAVGAVATVATGAAAVLLGGVTIAVPTVLGVLTASRARAWLRGEGPGRLLLTLGRLRVALQVDDGAAAAARAAAALRPWTRSAPLQDPAAYQDVQRRLDAALAGRPPPERSFGEDGEAHLTTLAVGDQHVHVSGDTLRVGAHAFPIQVVRQLAQVGDNLPLGRDAALQAAVALLVVAAEERRHAVEDPALLRARLTDYEKWSGQRAGR